MKHLLLTLLCIISLVPSATGQEMHRRFGASISSGISFKTAHNYRQGAISETAVKPGLAVGLNARWRLSPKSSLQLTGNLVLDRYTIQDHVEWRRLYYRTGGPDTTYRERIRGDLELRQVYWQVALAYRYTINHRWGASLGIRQDGLIREEGAFRLKNVQEHRSVANESTLVQEIDLDRTIDRYYLYGNELAGLRANVYCQLNRKLQLITSFDTPLVNYYNYTYFRYKLMLAYRLF